MTTDTRRPCKCGCGQLAPLHSRTGTPCDYVRSHNARITRRSYVRKRVNGESVQEHVVVAERALGKPLPPGAAVHHVDENKRNNANANLVICQDEAYHQHLHYRARIVRAGGNPQTHKICNPCGLVKLLTDFNRNSKTLSGYGSQCRQCSAGYFKRWSAAKAVPRGRTAA